MGYPSVLVLHTLGVSGHRAAALAVEAGLRAVEPGCAVEVVELVGAFHPALARVVQAAYHSVINHVPALWGAVHESEWLPMTMAPLGRLAGRVESRHLSDRIDELNPTCIVCTQAFACLAAAHSKQARPGIRLVACLTDFSAHGWWPAADADVYAVPWEGAAGQLVARGVPRDRIHVTGIPIHPRFSEPARDLGEIAASLGLRTGRPTVLVMGGSRGLGRIRAVLAELGRAMPEAQVIVACGTNEELRAELASQAGVPAGARILGYWERVDALMELAHVLVTKAGGVTVAEALAKRLPMVVLDPIPGQEEGNAACLVSVGAALLARDPADAARLARRVVMDEGLAARMRSAAGELAKPDSARAVALLALEMARC